MILGELGGVKLSKGSNSFFIMMNGCSDRAAVALVRNPLERLMGQWMTSINAELTSVSRKAMMDLTH